MMENSEHKGHRQRLKTRFETQLSGGQPLAECELAELLLTYAIPRRDVAPAAQRLLQRFGSLKNVFNAPAEELTSVSGISDAAALFLKLVGSVSGGEPMPRVDGGMQTQKRSDADTASDADRTTRTKPVLGSLSEAARFCRNLLCGREEECLLQVLVGEDSEVLSTALISGGGSGEVVLPTELIIANAGIAGASGVVIAHNHPSGDTRPSEADVCATRSLAARLEKQGVRLYEHFVVSDGGAYAMLNEEGIWD